MKHLSPGIFNIEGLRLGRVYVIEGSDGLTLVDTSLLGHSYVGDNRSILADLFELIRRGTPPEGRFALKPTQRYGARYWLFEP